LNRILDLTLAGPDNRKFKDRRCPKVSPGHLDKDSQGRIDDLGAPDPALAPNDEPAIP